MCSGILCDIHHAARAALSLLGWVSMNFSGGIYFVHQISFLAKNMSCDLCLIVPKICQRKIFNLKKPENVPINSIVRSTLKSCKRIYATVKSVYARIYKLVVPQSVILAQYI